MIVIEHLSKNYGDFKAVDDLSFTIEDGQVYGFLGPNGAGKSTTMNIMTGCLSSTYGKVIINGHDIFEEPKEAKKCIGYLPEIPPLYVDSIVKDYLRFVAEAKGINKNEIEKEIDKVVEETQIGDVKGRLIKHLSKGYRQRVGIAQALLGNPSIIILDEPTVGLDPAQIVEIRDLIKNLGKNHTIILSSHILSEVQNICEKILIINKGKLVAFDTPENLEKLFNGNTVIDCIIESKGTTRFIEKIEGVKNVEVEKLENGKYSYKIEIDSKDEERINKDLFQICSKKGYSILKMAREKTDLEDIFIELTNKKEEVIDDISI